MITFKHKIHEIIEKV